MVWLVGGVVGWWKRLGLQGFQSSGVRFWLGVRGKGPIKVKGCAGCAKVGRAKGGDVCRLFGVGLCGWVLGLAAQGFRLEGLGCFRLWWSLGR